MPQRKAAGTGPHGIIRIGIGGWSFPPWRQTFYPPEVKAAGELAWASRQLSSIEINATFYRTQPAHVFAHWAAETPDGFVFSVKAPRAATYTKDPDKAEASVERFLGSGLLALGDRLGPILWQFAPTRKFDPDSLDAFLRLLPRARDGIRLRHAIELRHPTARDPAVAGLLARHGAALAIVERPDDTPAVAATADFAYLRLEASQDEEPAGYPAKAIAAWAASLRSLAGGRIPQPLLAGLLGDAPAPGARDVFCYVISGAKHRNPAAARALIDAVAA